MSFSKGHYQYQHGLSDIHRESMFNAEHRQQKAKKTIAVIEDYLQHTRQRIEELSLLDIGCSAGFLTHFYGKYFRQVIGIDIDEKAFEHATTSLSSETVRFRLMDSMNIEFPENTFDAVTCTHIYEHVPDSKQLLSEIYRVLNPGGFCYFAAGNRLTLMEAHYRLPLLSAIPKWLAHYYVRWAGKADFYYETHLSYWGLKNLVQKFDLYDYTKAVVQDPIKYHSIEMIQPRSIKQILSLAILNLAYWASPTYIWVLRKPF